MANPELLLKRPRSQPKPLAVAIRALIAGGFAVGAGISPVIADGSHHLPENPTVVYGTATETLSNNGHTLTIDTTSPTTILDWNSFNIDKGYTVDFEGSASSVVLNNIGDQNATTIFGTLVANEQVYLVNQNGFIFEQGSEVNVNSLVATTLGISQEALLAGIANVFNNALNANASTAVAQGAALQVQDNGQNYLKDNQGNYIHDANGNVIPISIGHINVNAGATITTNAAGGLVLLAAPVVNNAGTITAPNGQVILAAAQDKVYLQDSSDAHVRGMLVEVGTGGQVTNTGTVLAQTGNVSMIGFAVNQQGIVSATTSVALNGSVRLMAEEGVQAPQNKPYVLTGNTTQRSAALNDGLGTNAVVKLTANSLTAVELDTSGATAIAAQAQPQSYIEISGHEVEMLNGSLVQAPSGSVNVEAWETPRSITEATGTIAPSDQGTARIYMETGSTIDVSGEQNVAESVADNIVSIKLQSNELRDSPLQRTGVLYGQTVYMDIRDAVLAYTNGLLTGASVPIADIIGSVQTIASNVDERSTAGGTINLNSTGDVILNSGSTLNFSGGSILYSAADVWVSTISSGGQRYDVSVANPNLIYSTTYGVQTQKVHELGYLQGGSGGTLSINSCAALLDGTLQGHTAAGELQRQSASWAAGSTLDINIDSNWVQQDVVFSNADSGLSLGPLDALPLSNNLAFSPMALNLNANMLNGSGIQNVVISTNGKLTVDSGTNLVLPDGGQFKATASDFAVLGGITAPSGGVNLAIVASNLGGAVTAGDIFLGTTGQINVSGVWINDRLDAQQQRTLGQVAINGGSVKLSGNITLSSGSQIHADGGAWKQVNAGITAGKGGSISLDASADSESLILNNSSLTAWGLQQDGSLTLAANDIVIGSTANGVANTLLLDPSFFQTGDFASYNLSSSVYALKVDENVQLNLEQFNRQLDFASISAATGSQLVDISQTVALTEGVRKPVDLTLAYTGHYTNNGQQQVLTIGSGALIQTDPGGSVTLNSYSSIEVDGSIITPAGTIALNINLPIADPGYIASQGIWLGANSQLLARGAFIPQVNNTGLTTGTVAAGGSVSLIANRGYIVTEAGADIDVSGASAALDSIQSVSGATALVTQNIYSAGGTIILDSGQGILADGSFHAQSGGGSAAGGSLSVALDGNLLNKGSGANLQSYPNLASTLILTSSSSNVAPTTEGSDVPLANADQAWLKSGLINAAGFSSIALKTDALLTNSQLTSAILFEGNVNLKASEQIILDTPNLEAQTAGQQIVINAPYVALGSSQVNTGATSNKMPTLAVAGTGTLTVTAEAGIDLVGGLSFNGIDQVNLTSSQGDLRMRGDGDPFFNNKDYLGVLNLLGNLDIKAERIYPATLTNYTINVSNTVTFESSGVNHTEVLSAGGNLIVNAADIDQKGTLEAPFGAITLNAADTVTLFANSTTSVSGAGSIVPFGIGSGGSIWEYPLSSSGNQNLVIYDQSTDNLPQKMLALHGNVLDLQKGANINLTGGGDLYAYEFIAGNGGSNDVLTNTVVNGAIEQFAVLPGIDTMLTPYDPQQYSESGLTTMGQSVYLNAADGLAAGWYTILPAHYALLPGAYLITPEAGTSGQLQTTYNAAGDAIVAGYYGVAGTSIKNTLSQGFEVQSGSIFTGSLSYGASGALVENSNSASPSQFTPYLGSTAITALASKYNDAVPQLPQDAGSLLLAATSDLNLDANLLAAPGNKKAQGGQVDISANKLEVVGSAADLSAVGAGTVGLLASQLSNFNAPSLLLGGQRSFSNKGEVLTVTASDVDIKDDVNGDNVLKGQEILLAASNQLTIEGNAQVQQSTTNATNTAGGTLIVENSNGTSDGALVRVSAAEQVVVKRDLPISGNGGELTLGNLNEAAGLQATGSILLDSTSTPNTVLNDNINQNGGSLGSLAFDSKVISIGDVPADTPGLVLSGLPANLQQLVINTGDLDVYGAATLNSGAVSISAANINGFNNSGLTASITATGELDLANNGAAAAPVTTPTGTGTLLLSANNIVLDSGQYAINGFSQVTMSAAAISGQGATVDPVTGDITSASPGVLTVDGGLTMNASQFSGGNGATTTINAGANDVTFNAKSSDANTTLPLVGLGVSWTVVGGKIDSTANFVLPTGILSFTATTGDVNLKNGSSIDLSGRAVAFSNAYKYSSGGSLTLVADQGNVNLLSGSTVKLAGDVEAVNGVKEQLSNAGSLNVQAVNGSLNWLGSVDASGGAVSRAAGINAGNFAADVSSFSNIGFSTLNNQLAAAGFSHDLVLEQQTGDLTIATSDILNASQFQLSVDQGKVTVDGTINVSGNKAGSVSIYGAGGITLAGVIDAYSTGAKNAGGTVTLDTVDRRGSDAGVGVLDLSSTTTNNAINVSGGAGGSGGNVLLRTGRDDNNGSVAVTAINTVITGAAANGVVLAATRVYADINAGGADANIITASNISQWQSDTAAFMNSLPNLVTSSGNALNLPTNIELLPGIEVRSSSSLTLSANAPWDFSSWRYNGLPGFLTLRAATDLNIDASISDGVVQNSIQPGLSWSYDLIAGDNVNLAASYSANGVDTQLVVRTGTGEIQIQAGENIAFNIDASGSLNATDDASAVYTVGATALFNTSSSIQQILAAYPDLPQPASANETVLAYLNSLTLAQQNQILRYGLLPESGIGSTYPIADYPTGGGNIALNAGGSIQGQQTGEQIASWLVTSGKGSSANSYTAWGIDISGGGQGSDANNHNFNQNVGALGGGNVTVQAGGNINDLSVMIPTTGKPLGEVAAYGRHNAITWEQSDSYTNGGGNLQMTAGNDISAGEYYVASGTASLTAGGSITRDNNNPTATTIGAILDLGNAVFNLQARDDLVLETAMNPTVLLPNSLTSGTIFFSYGADSALNLQSNAGNVVLLNNASNIVALKNISLSSTNADSNASSTLTDYPGILSVAALSGDLRIDNAMNLFPSVDGALTLLANGNIGIDASAVSALAGANLTITMSDVDPALLPSVLNPANTINFSNFIAYLSAANGYGLPSSSQIALGSQKTALIVANSGSISFPYATGAMISLPTAADIIAGGDITNFTVSTQNQSASDVTLIQAGGSINYDTYYDSNGLLPVSDSAGISVAGPGVLQVIAGGSINLGSSQGIDSIGNQQNQALPSTGAIIDVLAGISGQIDYAGFLDKYQSQNAYSAELQGIASLDAFQQRLNLTKLLNVMFDEIRLSAAAAAAAPEDQRYPLYQQGFDAIKTLFPDSNYAGDINMVFSQITTVMGGDINLAAPGGAINVGLAGGQSGNQKGANQLGILVQQLGALNILTDNDLNVNQSRVFTEGSGDITAWSSAGSIDAGKGARSALSPSQPVTVYSPGGQSSTNFTPTISGSGIQAVGGGNVYLAAPVGVVNAGEAGISGKDILIAATAVVGASNISASGATVGVPTAVVAPVNLAGVDSAAASATKTGAQSAPGESSNSNDDGSSKQKSSVSILNTAVIGFGKCSVADVKTGANGCGT